MEGKKGGFDIKVLGGGESKRGEGGGVWLEGWLFGEGRGWEGGKEGECTTEGCCSFFSSSFFRSWKSVCEIWKLMSSSIKTPFPLPDETHQKNKINKMK